MRESEKSVENTACKSVSLPPVVSVRARRLPPEAVKMTLHADFVSTPRWTYDVDAVVPVIEMLSGAECVP